MRVHPFPSRTRKLSSLVPTILGWKRPGTIGRRQHKHSSIAQPVEHATVNRRVVGSSPTWGASERSERVSVRTFCFLTVPLWFPASRPRGREGDPPQLETALRPLTRRFLKPLFRGLGLVSGQADGAAGGAPAESVCEGKRIVWKSIWNLIEKDGIGLRAEGERRTRSPYVMKS